MNFQKKIHRSKVFHAKMTNNKEMLGQLTKHDNYNFQVGGNKCTSDDSMITTTRSKSAPLASSDETSRRKSSSKTKTRPSTSKPNRFRRGFRPAATATTAITPSDVKLDTDLIVEDLTSVTLNDKDVDNENDKPQKEVSAKLADGEGTPPVSKDSTHGKAEQANHDEEPVGALKSPSSVSISLKPRRNAQSATVRKEMPPARSIGQYDKVNRPKTAIGATTLSSLRAETPDVKDARPNSAVKIHSDSADNIKENSDDKPPKDSSDNIIINSEDNVPPFPADETLSFKSRSPPSRSKRKQSASPSRGMPSMFGEEKRPTIFELNEDRIRRARHSDRVTQFVNSLSDIRREQPPDYYAIRLSEMTTRRKPTRPSSGETRYDNNEVKRSVGNLRSMNMTFRSVVDPKQLNK